MGGNARMDRSDKLSLPLTSLPGLLLVAMLALLNHLGHPGLARSLPTATPGLGMLQCLSHSQNLLRAVGNMLQKVSFSVFPFPLCSLCREGASLNPRSPEGTAEKLWTLIRRCQEGERELYKWPN